MRQRVAHERRKLVLGQPWGVLGVVVAAWVRMLRRIWYGREARECLEGL